MLYIPKIDEGLEILTNKEVKDIATINFSELLKPKRDGQYFRKVAK